MIQIDLKIILEQNLIKKKEVQHLKHKKVKNQNKNLKKKIQNIVLKKGLNLMMKLILKGLLKKK